jgi:hypothetical protein
VYEKVSLQELECRSRVERGCVEGLVVHGVVRREEQRGPKSFAPAHGQVSKGIDERDHIVPERLGFGELALEEGSEPRIDVTSHLFQQRSEGIRCRATSTLAPGGGRSRVRARRHGDSAGA